MSNIDELNVGNDRLVGAEAIAEFRGEDVARTSYLIRCGRIPVYREGRLIVASRRTLREHHLEASKRMLVEQQQEAEAAR
jgi:hypothetical protein